LFLHGIDELARERAAGDGARLERGHRHARLDLAAAERLHDEDGERGDHDILRHEKQQIAAAHADEFRCPEFLFLHRIILSAVLLGRHPYNHTKGSGAAAKMMCRSSAACFAFISIGIAMNQQFLSPAVLRQPSAAAAFSE